MKRKNKTKNKLQLKINRFKFYCFFVFKKVKIFLLRFLTEKLITNYVIEQCIEKMVFHFFSLNSLVIGVEMQTALDCYFLKILFIGVGLIKYYYSELVKPILNILFSFIKDEDFREKNYRELVQLYGYTKNKIILLWLVRYPFRPMASIIRRKLNDIVYKIIYEEKVYKEK